MFSRSLLEMGITQRIVIAILLSSMLWGVIIWASGS